MSTANAEDLIVWPDGSYCYRYELPEMDHMSDDYEVIPFGTPMHEHYLHG